MRTLNQDSVWEADGEVCVNGERGGLKHPCSGLSPDSGVSQRVLEALRRGT